MGFMDTLWSSRKKEAPLSTQTVSLEELSRDYNLELIDGQPGMEFAIATPIRHLGQEVGSSSPSPFTSFTRQEYNPLLMGLSGLQMFDKMRKSDGTVRGSIRAIKTPALSGRWFVEATKVDEDLHDVMAEATAWIWRNLTELMSISWPQVLTEALLMCDFGYFMFEKVWENRVIDGEMRTVLTKLAPRHPMDVADWKYDKHGGPAGVWMYCEVDNQNPQGKKYIPIEKLLVFTFDREAGNIEGISVLRSAYKHWYYKEQLYKIDAIQKERHGIGIPVIKLPMGYKDEDKRIAEELGRNIRTNERAHIVLPPGWELAMLKLEGQPVDALKSIEHHNAAIRENILVNFVVEGAREEDLAMFLKASRFVADIVAETFNQYLMPQMCYYNFPELERCPRLKVRRIGEAADWRTMTFGIRNLVGAGVIIPDETLEANLREEMDLPAIDKDSARLIATPQNPYDINEDIDDPYGDMNNQGIGENDEGDRTHNNNSPQYNRNRRRIARGRKPGRKQSGQVAGLPRQTTVGGARNSYGLPRSNGGQDRSGG